MTNTTTFDPPTESPEAITKHTHAERFPNLENLPLNAIDRSRNHRIPRAGDEQRIVDLMNSIEASGQLQPVRVYEVEPAAEGERRVDPDNPGAKQYILGFGWRRTEAMARLGYELVRCEVFPPAPDHEIEAARAIENIHRQDITPIEEAQAVADIVGAYEKDRPTASRTEALQHAAAEAGRPESWVRDRDYFTRLTDPVRELAMRCGLPAGHLREIAKLGDEELQLRAALFAVKGSGSWFKPGTLTPKGDHWSKSQAKEFFEEIDGGKINREPIQRVKQHVDEQQRSLKSVPWVLTLPVLVRGKGALPACDECPHNTATDATLFGVEEGDGPGRCMNPGCFEQKTKAAESERLKAAKHATRKVKHDDATKAKQAVERAPGWLDVKKLTGFVKREQKKASQGKPTKAETPQRQARGDRKPTPHEAALGKYEKALDPWFGEMDKAIEKLANEKPCRRAALRLLLWLQLMEDIDEVRTPYINLWRPPSKPEAPKMPEALSKKTRELLALATSDDPEKVVEIATHKAMKWGAMEDLPRNPDLLTSLVTGWGGSELIKEPCPRWEDFAPKAEAEAKPAPKKKAARKKVAKKKATKKKAGSK